MNVTGCFYSAPPQHFFAQNKLLCLLFAGLLSKRIFMSATVSEREAMTECTFSFIVSVDVVSVTLSCSVGLSAQN